jgi:hypothetical protein
VLEALEPGARHNPLLSLLHSSSLFGLYSAHTHILSPFTRILLLYYCTIAGR